jgi:choline transport protein
VLSYFAGWQSTLAWQAGNASGPFITGELMQALISLSIPSYAGTNWQASLLVIINVGVVLLVNIYGAGVLPHLQTGFALMHCVWFIAVIAVLWTRAPQATAKDVFMSFENMSGWPSMGLSLCVGQISAIWGLIGSDAAAHMSEVSSSPFSPMHMLSGCYRKPRTHPSPCLARWSGATSRTD